MPNHRTGIARAAALLTMSALLVGACARGSTGPTASGSSPAPTSASSTPATTASATAASATAASATASIPTDSGVALEVVSSGLVSPVDVTTAEDGSGRIFVVEQGGTIRTVTNGTLDATPFLDVSDRLTSGGEQGLLGLAFHPGYPTDPRFFVDYTNQAGATVIASFTVDPATPGRADPGSERILLTIAQPYPNHNGGALAFGPDGMLYIAMGDGGSGGDPHGNGQRLDTLLGKILRIDVGGRDATAVAATTPYAIPPDNPFVATAGARPEIWLLGLRNPWRMRFDDATGDLWIGDVGQGDWEEIDAIRAGTSGQDLGWNIMEGTHCFKALTCDQAGLTPPVAEYGHGSGCAVVGGVVARNDTVPGIRDRYVFADYCSGNVWTLDPTGDRLREPDLVLSSGRNISAIGSAEDGTVLMTDFGAGQLLRVVSAE
jgi:glucose/arabinose dehydrogenase